MTQPRWAGRHRFVVLETGFGLGHHFLATRAAWQADTARCGQLVFISLASDPPQREELVHAHRGSALHTLAEELAAAWPPLTPNIHLLEFDGGHVRLLLAVGDPRRVLRQLSGGVDAFYLGGAEPEPHPERWDRHFIAGLARLAQPGATLATRNPSQALRATLAAAGFVTDDSPGPGGNRGTTLAHYAPSFAARRSPVRSAVAATAGDGGNRHAVIVGAGIAGASAAAALARLGWRCSVLERHAEPASEASGNPAGLFHGTAHAVDGVHSRLHRAAALLAARRYAALINTGCVAGSAAGLLRRHPGPLWSSLPPDYVQLCDEGEAAFYAAAGWVAPRDVVRALLDHAAVTFRGGTPVHSLLHDGSQWKVLGAKGQTLASATVVVLAGAQANLPLMASTGHPGWPTVTSRGQLTWFSTDQRLGLPVTGEGYAMTLPGGQLLCGATSQEGDADPAVREADHAFNLARLGSLAGIAPEPGAVLHGRVAWRSQTPDRLPIVGAVPLVASAIAPGTRLDQARRVPRLPGLFVLGGLGSRGLTWGPLAGEVLAAWIDGAPMPLEADLLDAIDPARWIVRSARKA